MTQIPTWSGGPVSPPTGRAAPGTTIGGRYSLRSPVGNGGMGTVWRATDTLLRRDVAVKEVVLPPGLAPSDRDAMYERTLREARAAAAIQHPAVVQVYDVVTEGGRPWIVMELLDARSLADMVIEDGPVAPRAVAKIGIALLGALEVAHAIGVLHRDVKPANVLICTDGRCVLTDFGVARMPTDVQLTTPGMVLGSPHFISPERAMGQDFGPPSDLFSLGVTLYTAVEGRPPFDKGDPIETMHAVVEDPPATPQRSGPLTRVLMGLLEKDPARRLDVHTARGMLRELLAGPLTSNNTAVNSVTDPYAVVPVQRPSAPPPAAPEPKPTGQIGGRAMIGPGESLTDRLAALRRGERPAPAGAAGAALDETSADALAGPLHTPTGAMPSGAPEATQRISPDATQRLGVGGAPDAIQRLTPGVRPEATQRISTGHPDATQPVYGRGVEATQAVYGGNQWSVPGTGQPWAAPAPAGRPGKGRGLGQLVDTVKGWPRKVQLATAGGVAVLLLVGVIALAGGGDDSPPPIVTSLPTGSAPAAPPVDMEEQSVKGVTLQVPKGWDKNTGGVFVDFVDPKQDGRKVRVLAEKWGGTSTSWAEFASRNLRDKSKSCAKPYEQLAMTETKLADKPAAEFEYTCGDGDSKRHGVWRGVVQDGKVYSFYLTANDADFAASRPIFDAMASSFKFGEDN
ncbi:MULTISPECIES: serine/threonine-protein kinase [Micromonospora]|uniref:non-specific serine/threonine protein kinase n=1 Tax=Micromonospora solifontis TaxID=2487138 RepID=A0ABX9WLC9_9ACTN|nr:MULTISPECIES: serine/threonine-protein kinase [Micromonospora]NES14387.1 protein kinase [Micromonospora sp. PPF5-17B]NES35005.1 protein kinase [Micromonospora solifontis]NES57494.1 protein kinase [Micromonospora sp. PPF5-6]RNM01277.1 serine/threonine protein kinase [Micromonospora solifontis]